MTYCLTRRRFLSISAAATVGLSSPATASQEARWRGHALGADCSMRLEGVDKAQAGPVFRAVERELSRLERVFSLYRTDSQLVHLNATGSLHAPAPELLEVLSLCDRLHRATGGAFDPTLQPLWIAHARASARGYPANEQELAQARALIGWKRVRVDTDRIQLKKPGMALTLNGVAQGYITDRIRALLIERGLNNTLIDMGEIAASGRRADGQDWVAGIASPDGQLVARVTLGENRALATSAPEGTILDNNAGIGHILDPRNHETVPVHRLVSVSSPIAALADGLSTAGCVMSQHDLVLAVGNFPESKLETQL